ESIASSLRLEELVSIPQAGRHEHPQRHRHVYSKEIVGRRRAQRRQKGERKGDGQTKRGVVDPPVQQSPSYVARKPPVASEGLDVSNVLLKICDPLGARPALVQGLFDKPCIVQCVLPGSKVGPSGR